MTSFDVITIGNATIDAFLGIHDANVHCRINEKDSELCIKYGEKIPVDTCEFQMGGNAANVAVGISRLGLGSSLVAEIGDDEFAKKIIHSLSEEHIDTTFLIQTPHTPSSFAIGINFKEERTLFVKHSTRAHKFAFPDFLSDWMYLTSLGDEWKHVYKETARMSKEKAIKIAFSPGTYQLKDGVEHLLDVLNITEILFVNLEEAEKIAYGKEQMANGLDRKEIKKLLEALHALGPRIVVITDGENGSYTVDKEGNMYHLGIVSCPVIERTGAGDAYASGFLAANVLGESVQEAMRWGTINATAVIGKIGAEAGLLTKEAMQEKLEEHQALQAKTL